MSTFRRLLVFLLLASSALLGADLAVNKYVCRAPQAGTPVPAPDKADGACDDLSIAQVGTVVTYYVTVANRDQNGNNTVNLTDTLPPGFVLVGTPVCQTFGTGADCGTGPQVSGSLITYTSMTIPTTGTVTIRIDGYFTQTGKPLNAAEGGPHTGTPGSNKAAKEVSVPAYALGSDLSVDKTVEAVKGQPNRFRYKITVKNTGQTVYPEGLLRLDDGFTFSAAPLAFQVLNYKCTPSAAPAGVCPTAPAPLSGNAASTQYWFYQNWTVPSGTTTASDAFEARGQIEIEFEVEFNPLCGAGTLSTSNKASLAISATGEALDDSNDGNNQASAGPVTLPYEKPKCGTIGKTRLDGRTDWGVPQKYTITLVNYEAAAAEIDVTDYYHREPGTPPFEVTAISTPVCAPATCSTPTVSAVPVKILAEYTRYLLFSLRAKVPPATGNQPGTLTISFEVTLKPLATCQPAKAPGKIWNTAYSDWVLSEKEKVRLGGSSADFTPKPLPECRIVVTKEVLEGSPLVFGQNVKFKVNYQNTSSSSLEIWTLADVMGIDSSAWGPLPINVAATSNCTATGVTPQPTLVTGSKSVSYASPVTQGPGFISGGPFTFQPGGSVACQIEFTAAEPPANDAFCSAADAKLFNTAVMDPGVVAMWVSPLVAKNAPVSVPLPKCRKVLIQKTVEQPQYLPGETVVFTIQVTNTGNDALAGVVVNDPLPPGFVATSVTCSACLAQPTFGGNVVNATLATMAAQATVTIVVKATAPATGGSYTNVASLVLPEEKNTFFEGGGRSNVANVQVLTPRLLKAFSKSTAVFGETVDLTFTIQNVRGKAETGISFTDTLPPGLVYGAVTANTCGGQVTIQGAGTALTLTGGTLEEKKDCAIRVTVKVVACGVLRNQWNAEPGKSNISNTNNIDPTGVSATLEAANCPPSLTVQKNLVGAPEGYTGTFKFDVTCVTPEGLVQKELSLTWPANTVGLTGILAGSTCTVREKDLPAAPTGYQWSGAAVYSPAQTIVIKPGEGNVIGVRNAMKYCDDRGEVKITKKLENVPPGFSGTFQFNVFCVSGTTTFTKTVQIRLPGAPTISVTGMPSGSTCTVTEVGPLPALPAGWDWLAPAYSPANGQLVLAPLCCQEVVVTNRAKFCCIVDPSGYQGYKTGTGTGTGTSTGTAGAGATRRRTR